MDLKLADFPALIPSLVASCVNYVTQRQVKGNNLTDLRQLTMNPVKWIFCNKFLLLAL